MKEKLTVRKANKDDIPLIQNMIKKLALYEKRPQDMTGSEEELDYWLFKRETAVALIAEYDCKAIGYAIYYPVFGSFAAKAGVHLEDLLMEEEYRRRGFGKEFFYKIEELVKQEGYTRMEWSCLDWNTPAIDFYNKIGADKEQGRKYFSYTCE